MCVCVKKQNTNNKVIKTTTKQEKVSAICSAKLYPSVSLIFCFYKFAGKLSWATLCKQCGFLYRQGFHYLYNGNGTESDETMRSLRGVLRNVTGCRCRSSTVAELQTFSCCEEVARLQLQTQFCQCSLALCSGSYSCSFGQFRSASVNFLLLCPKLLLLFHAQLLSHLLFELPISLGKQCSACFRLTVYNLHVESSSHPPAPILHGIFQNPPFCVVYDVTETLANYLFGTGVGLKCAVDK